MYPFTHLPPTHTLYRMTQTRTASYVCLFVCFLLKCVYQERAHVLHVCGRFKAFMLKWNKRDTGVKEKKKIPKQKKEMLGFWTRERGKKACTKKLENASG